MRKNENIEAQQINAQKKHSGVSGMVEKSVRSAQPKRQQKGD
jgi:hypothetical protein